MQVRRAREQYVRWLVVAKDLSPHTVRAYDCDIAALEEYIGPRKSVRQIDRERLIDFIEIQRQLGHSSPTIKRRASGLRGFFRWLVSCEVLGSDPWAGITVASGRSRKLPRVLPVNELNRLLTSLLNRSSMCTSGSELVPARAHESTTLLAVALMVSTGIRVNEAVSLKCHDIDLSGRSLRILGKGGRERQVFLTNNWIASLTASYLQARDTLGLGHPYLLLNSRNEPLTTASMRLKLAKAASEAGLSARITPHMLRHTAATQLIEAGVDIRYIQRLLGHASLTTTEIYTHVSDRALRQVVSEADVLERLIKR